MVLPPYVGAKHENLEKPIRVLVADDHALIRAGLRAMIAGNADITIIGEAANGNEAQQRSQQLQPDVLLLDLSMPGPTALEILTGMPRTAPHTRILILTAYNDDAYIRPLLNAGVSGYLLKDEAPDVILQAIRSLAHGAPWYSLSVLADLAGAENIAPIVQQLPPQEQQLFWLLVAEWDDKRIARFLNLADTTVRQMIRKLYQFIGINSRAELMVWVRQLGIEATLSSGTD